MHAKNANISAPLLSLQLDFDTAAAKFNRCPGE
jgi:hypothetical protein